MPNGREEANPTLFALNYAGKSAGTGALPGIPSGLAALDEIITCWRKSSLTLIAGAPSMGCTALLLACMRHAAEQSRRGAVFFSLQLRTDKLLAKWISQEMEVAYANIETGQLTETERTQLNDFVRRWEQDAGTLVSINDAPNPTITSIVNDCRRLKASGAELFLIDNINRIALGRKARARCGNREQELAYIVRRLKTLAHELDAPLLVVSQLSRAASERGRNGHPPQLTDLRDSGALENEADVVVLLYRAEYYGLDEDYQGRDTTGRADLIVAKNAFGKTATARVGFRAEIGLFTDLDDEDSASDADEGKVTGHPFAPNSIRLGTKINEHPTPFPKSNWSNEEPPF